MSDLIKCLWVLFTLSCSTELQYDRPHFRDSGHRVKYDAKLSLPTLATNTRNNIRE